MWCGRCLDHARCALTAVLTKNVLKSLIQRLGHLVCHLRRPAAATVRHFFFRPSICGLVILHCPRLQLRRFVVGWRLAMWRRSSLELGRRAVPLGFRGMASVTSTGLDKCGGDNKGGGDKGKHVEVPLPMHGVAGKYAAALYISAVRANALDPVRGDLEQVAGVAGMETLFAEFLRDPSVPKPARMKACEDIFKETKFHDVSKNFIAVLAENGRLSFVQHIYKSFCELLLAHHGDIEVQVTTALELTAAELEDIKKALSGQARLGLKQGQNVKITQRVDRSIIGGIVLAIGDKLIDLSIDRKIKMMEKDLAKAV